MKMFSRLSVRTVLTVYCIAVMINSVLLGAYLALGSSFAVAVTGCGVLCGIASFLSVIHRNSVLYAVARPEE